MCTTLFAQNAHPDYPLVFLSNRDEFHHRKTEPAHFWADAPGLLGGRDLEAGGTWLAVDQRGRIANLTNYRDFRETQIPDAPSRGHLVTEFLLNDHSPETYLQALSKKATEYNGFNLLTGHPGQLFHFSNRENKLNPVPDGVHGLSNHLLDSPWPKVETGKAGLSEILQNHRFLEPELFQLMHNMEEAPEDQLPDTGGGVEFEKRVSPRFILDEVYGTRCITVITVHKSGNLRFTERRYSNSGEMIGESTFAFGIEGY